VTETRVHQFEKDLAFRTGDDGYVRGKLLRAGEVLELTHLSGSFENIATSEYIEFGYWNGHAYVPIETVAPKKTSGYANWDGIVFLRENQYYYIYCADVANGEKMKLRANGQWL
jgi:hypothetical protein